MRSPNDYSLNKVARFSLQGSRKSGVAFKAGQQATHKSFKHSRNELHSLETSPDLGDFS